MKKLMRAVLSLLLIVCMVAPGITSYAAPPPMNSEGDGPTSVPGDPGSFNPWLRLPILCLGVMAVPASSNAEAAAIVRDTMIHDLPNQEMIRIYCDSGKDGNLGWLQKDSLVRENPNLFTNALSMINQMMVDDNVNHAYYSQSYFAGGDAELANWIEMMFYGLKPGKQSMTAVDAFGNKDILKKIFKRMSECTLLMSPDKYQEFCSTMNSDGCGVYYILTISRAQASVWAKKNTVDPVAKTCEFEGRIFGPGSTTGFSLIEDNGYSSFGEFSNAVYTAAYENGTTIDVCMQNHCCTPDDIRAHNGDCSDGEIYEAAKSLYIQEGGLNYYGRGYWGVGANWGVSVPPSPTTFLYSVESNPKDRMANIHQGQMGEYYIHLRKGAGGIAESHTYRVVIGYESSNRAVEGNAASNNPVRRSGSRTSSPMKVYAASSVQNPNDYLYVPGKSYGVSSNTSQAVFTISGKQLYDWCNGTWLPYIQSMSSGIDPTLTNNAIFQPLKFSVSVTDTTNGASCFVDKDVTGMYDGWDAGSSTNYCSWIGIGSGNDIPWEWHSSYDYKAYAEIVANEIGAKVKPDGSTTTESDYFQDWNVFQGIPSTENLSIAAGGTLFVSDFAGYVHIRGSRYDEAAHNAANVGDGTYMPGILNRVINIRVQYQNWWGVDNNRCVLSCPGHKDELSGNGIGDTKCTVCGVTPGANFICDKCGRVGYSERSCQKSGCTGSYKRSDKTCGCAGASLTVSCATGDINANNCTTTTGTMTQSSNKQRYKGTISATTAGGATLTVTAGSDDLACEGYTTGYGCAVGHKTNCIHREKPLYDFYVVESIDMFAWKEITDGVVYALTKAEITDIDTNVISDSALGRLSSTSTGQNTMWRGRGYMDDNPFNMYGRLYYTMFRHPLNTLNQGFGGGGGAVESVNYWTLSRNAWYGNGIDNTTPAENLLWGHSPDQGYHCSNVQVVITVNARPYVDDSGSPLGPVTNMDPLPNLSAIYGQDEEQYSDADNGGCTDDSYDHYPGAKVSESDLRKLATRVANAWQGCMKDDDLTVMILSDAMTLGSHYSGYDSSLRWTIDVGYQDIINGLYAVDEGIKLFNQPFESPNEVHYRNHRSQYSKDALEGLCYGEFGFDTHDGAARIGYTGQPSSNPAEKYQYVGESEGHATTMAGGMHTEGSPWRCVEGSGFKFYLDEPIRNNFGGWFIYDSTSRLAGFNLSDEEVGWLRNRLKGVESYIAYCSWAPHYHKPDGEHWICTAWHVNGVTLEELDEIFDGYYRDHEYIVDHGRNTKIVYNNTLYGDSEDGVRIPEWEQGPDRLRELGSVTDNGFANVTCYGCPYVISNIDIKDTAKNGVYSNSVKVECVWEKTIEFHTKSTEGPGPLTDLVSDRFASEGGIHRQTAVYSDTYQNVKGESGVINDIVIHDPVSTQYWAVIGNNYGSYADGIKDESGEDMRIFYKGVLGADGKVSQVEIPTPSEKDKSNYIVMGNTFHVWVCDYGDFRDPSGSWDVNKALANRGVGSVAAGSNSQTGERYENGRGYTDTMNTGIWVKDRYVQFSFPVSYVAVDNTIKAVPAGEAISLADVKCTSSKGRTDYAVKDIGTLTNGNYLDSSGNRVSFEWGPKNTADNPANGDYLFHYGSEKLQNFRDGSSISDIDYRYGLDYEFTVLPSAAESTSAKVRFSVESINSDGTYKPGVTNKDRKGDLSANSAMWREDSVQVVGRIGNFAIEDVGDFRYSELFKKVMDYNSWLIPGVIHKVDSTVPNVVISTKYDILGDDTSTSKYVDDLTEPYGHSHAQASITNYIIGTKSGFGKAGKWLPCPLVASYNPVKEYKDEQMRMGYYAYLDIETMGSYYGINYAMENKVINGIPVEVSNPNFMDRGPTCASEVGNDKRKYTMDIVPKYFLYDMDSNKFYGIRLYYGNQGKRELFWNDGADISKDITSLYINMDAEMGRRNTTESERQLTNLLLFDAPTLKASAFTGEDFIGTASKIRLDQYDRAYIGTTIRDGYIKKTGSNMLGIKEGSIASEWFTNSNWTGVNNSGNRKEAITDYDFGVHQQRWYFTLGLPSSTYVTYAEDRLDTQSAIEKSHENLMRDHPNSVIVCYLDIRVKGLVWDLGYKASLVNDKDNYPYIIPDDPSTPEDESEKFPDPGTVYVPENPDDPDSPDRPVGSIDPDWQPTIVYETEKTSADDWDTYGTH